METNEIIKNEEVSEVLTGEILDTESSGKGFKVALGIGAVALCGIVICKYAARPVIAKIKAKRAEKKDNSSEEDYKNDEDIIIEE